MARKGININDLPEKYRKQIETQISDTAANLEQHSGNGVKKENPVQKVTPPVDIEVYSRRKRLCDSDGISAKWAIDSIVRAGILEDDRPSIVNTVTYRQEKADKDETIIFIKTVGII